MASLTLPITSKSSFLLMGRHELLELEELELERREFNERELTC